MRKTIYIFILALIIVPTILLTSSCKKEDVSPVGTTHPYSGFWNIVDSASLRNGDMIINVDGDFNFLISLYRDSLVHLNSHRISGNIATSGQISGNIKDSTGIPVGTLSGTLSGTGGTGTYVMTSVPYSSKWGAKKE